MRSLGGDSMTTYRLRYRNAYMGTPDKPSSLYYRRRSKDPRHGYLRYWVVEADRRPTEWRTLDGISGWVEAHPTLLENFEIVEVTA